MDRAAEWATVHGVEESDTAEHTHRSLCVVTKKPAKIKRCTNRLLVSQFLLSLQGSPPGKKSVVSQSNLGSF